MGLMSVSQYAKHAGMSRQALYSWEAKQGFPARVDGKIDPVASDAYLARFRDSHDLRTKNAKSKPAPATAKAKAGKKLMEMSVADIKQHLAACVGQAAGMDQGERVKLAAGAVGLFLSEGPDNPPVTFGRASRGSGTATRGCCCRYENNQRNQRIKEIKRAAG